MKRPLLLILPLLLAACVDTTGISPESSRPPAGNPNAGIVVAEYADLQCPACRSAHTILQGPLLEKYGSQIRFEFHHFPLRNLHRFAMDLAEASECAADQGKFWEFESIVYNNQPDLKEGQISGGQFREILAKWVENAGVKDQALFDRCTGSHIKRKEILADYDRGEQSGVRGTPTFFVNGKQVEATYEALSAAIESNLQGQAQKL